MYIVLNMVLILCILFAGYNALTLQQIGNAALRAEVIASKVNVRSGPEKDRKVTFQLKQGEKVVIGQKNGDWWAIETQKREGLFPKRGWVNAKLIHMEEDKKVNIFYRKSEISYMGHEVQQSLITSGIIYLLISVLVGMTNTSDVAGHNMIIWAGGILTAATILFVFSASRNPFVTFGICSVSSSFELIMPLMLSRVKSLNLTFNNIFFGFKKTIVIYAMIVFPVHLLDYIVPVRMTVQQLIAEM